MRKRELTAVLAVFALFIAPMVSAEILLGQVESLYNIGDTLDFNITLISATGTSDFLVTKIVCDSGDIEVFKSPYNLKAGEHKSISVSVVLDSLLVRNLEGVCYASVNYGGESLESQRFDITRKVSIQFSADSVVDPGKEIKITGIARKANGQPLEGFVDASISELGLSNMGIVKNGNFNLSLIIPKKAGSGNYNVVVKAYDKDDLKVTANEGESSSIIRVKQIVERADIALDKVEVSPNENLTYTILLYDQADDLAKQEVKVTIFEPNGNLKDSFLASSGVAYVLPIKQNYLPGYWSVKAEFGGLNATRAFIIKEFEQLSFSIINGTLIASNTGNIPINKPVDITIGEFSEIKEISLDAGASKKFLLSAPDGKYDIAASDGNNSYALGTTFLTGRAVSIKESIDSSANNLSFWLWAILILILCAFALYFYWRNKKKNYYGKEPRSRSGRSGSEYKYGSLRKVSEIMPSAGKAIPDFGKKEKAVVVGLKIRNSADLENAGAEALAVIGKIISNGRAKGARYKDEGEYKLFVFSPTFTKDASNGARALNFTKLIKSTLDNYNAKYALKVEFGLGINNGEVIIELREGKHKFSSIGNVIVVAKKAASRSKGEILASHAFRKDFMNIVRGEPMPGENFWRVNNIIDRNPQNEFLERFKKRQGLERY